MSTPLHANNKRWWLWWPLLALLAWLVVQEQQPSQPGNGHHSSLATAVPPSRSPTGTSAPTRRSGTTLPDLVPRDQLLATSLEKTRHGRRDLFAARPAPPPLAALPPRVEAPSPPALPFRYVGKQWDGQTWEVYAVSGNQTYVLREGQALDDQYRVDRIAPPHAAITYLPLSTVQHLPIGDMR